MKHNISIITWQIGKGVDSIYCHCWFFIFLLHLAGWHVNLYLIYCGLFKVATLWLDYRYIGIKLWVFWQPAWPNQPTWGASCNDFQTVLEKLPCYRPLVSYFSFSIPFSLSISRTFIKQSFIYLCKNKSICRYNVLYISLQNDFPCKCMYKYSCIQYYMYWNEPNSPFLLIFFISWWYVYTCQMRAQRPWWWMRGRRSGRCWTVCWINLTAVTVRTGPWLRPSLSYRWVRTHAHV